MKLRHILFNRVRSDTGFVVKIRSIQGYAEYREGDRIAVVPVEEVIGKPLIHVHKDTPISWNPPHREELITDEKRKEILQNIVAAIQFRKGHVEMV